MCGYAVIGGGPGRKGDNSSREEGPGFDSVARPKVTASIRSQKENSLNSLTKGKRGRGAITLQRQGAFNLFELGGVADERHKAEMSCRGERGLGAVSSFVKVPLTRTRGRGVRGGFLEGERPNVGKRVRTDK